MKDYHKHRETLDCVRRQSDERKKRERFLRSRLPLDANQQAKVEAQIRKIAEREDAERLERRNQHAVLRALIDEAAS